VDQVTYILQADVADGQYAIHASIIGQDCVKDAAYLAAIEL
jgi:hypothetical protein